VAEPLADFGWLAVARLGLVQACIGSVVVLTTATLNRIMVVELALPALLPGVLVALHYLVQVMRPRMGHGSDVGGRRTPWIMGGMVLLASGGVVAAYGVSIMGIERASGIAAAFVGFAMIGLGVSASGTALLALLAKRVDAPRRASAATIVWLMMIVGFAVTAGTAGRLLDPYTPARLLIVSSSVSLIAVIVTLGALFRVEGRGLDPRAAAAAPRPTGSFRTALAQVWREAEARRFTIFVFVSMLAYSAQDLILEPFAGTVFGFTPGESTSLSGVQLGGVLVGMLFATLAGRRLRGRSTGSLQVWTITGCALSACALAGLVAASLIGPAWPFRATVFLLGAANGVFSIAAIGSMMRLATQGRDAREGMRMGLWGAAQAVAFGCGGLVGTGASDLARWLLGAPQLSYASVFAFEALLFVLAAWLAAGVGRASVTTLPARTQAADLAIDDGHLGLRPTSQPVGA
jgi:BCD family chlorophyll transporter-like MFS transporter